MIEETKTIDTKPSIIEGPISLTEHFRGPTAKDPVPRHIYIFGDWHQLGESCSGDPIMKIQDVINIAIKTQREYPIDIFLEAQYLYKSFPVLQDIAQDSYLSITNKLFSKCLTIDKKECPFSPKQARFHYLDLRSLDNMINRLADSTSDLVNAITQLYNILLELYTKDAALHTKNAALYTKNAELYGTGKQLVQIENEDMQQIISAANYLALLLNESDVKNAFSDGKKLAEWIDTNLNYHKIAKQINAIDDPTIKELIKSGANPSSIIDEYKLFTDGKAIIRLLTTIKNIIDNPLSITNLAANLPILDKFNEFLILLQSHYIDLYTLGRMFRTFSDGSKSRSIILYAGEAHAEFYRSILDKIGFEKITSIYGKDDTWQCLPIPELRWPLFS